MFRQAILSLFLVAVLGGCASTDPPAVQYSNDPPHVQYIKERGDRRIQSARITAEHLKLDRSAHDSLLALLAEERDRAHARADSLRSQSPSLENVHQIDEELDSEIDDRLERWLEDYPDVKSRMQVQNDQVGRLLFRGALGDPEHIGRPMISAAKAAGLNEASQRRIVQAAQEVWKELDRQNARVARETAPTTPHESADERQMRIERARFNRDPKMVTMLLALNDQLNELMTPEQRATFDSKL
jgi:hypothetical protein